MLLEHMNCEGYNAVKRGRIYARANMGHGPGMQLLGNGKYFEPGSLICHFTTSDSRNMFQRLKKEALILAPGDCEVRSVIKLFECTEHSVGRNYCQLCQVYDHTRLDGQHISCRNSAGRCLIIHLIARTSRPVISIFPYTSRNSSRVASAF